MGFKDKLTDLHDVMAEAEKEARELKNQNLADVIAAGRAKIKQATEHPDVHVVGAENPNQARGHDPLNSGGNMMFSAGDPGRALQDAEAARRAAFPGTSLDPLTGKSRSPPLDPHAKHPGDPSFDRPNADFKNPNAVNLNDDGTAKQAPNTLGASDDRGNKPYGTGGSQQGSG